MASEVPNPTRRPDAAPPEDAHETWNPMAAVPVALPVDLDAEVLPDTIPVAIPVYPAPERAAAPLTIADLPVEVPREFTETIDFVPSREPPVPPPVRCPVCGWTRVGQADCCRDCGYYFSAEDLAGVEAAGTAPVFPAPVERLQGRYELLRVSDRRGPVARYRGQDHGDGTSPPVPVVVLHQALVVEEMPPPVPATEPIPDDEVLPGFDVLVPTSAPTTEVMPPRPDWPGCAWERELLRAIDHPGMPRLLDSVREASGDYLVVEVPQGRSLWDAWDDPEATFAQRFSWLAQLADLLHQLHQCGAMLEGLRPDFVVVTPEGVARLTDLADLLPLPVRPDTAFRGSLYTAPELLAGGPVDARAALYGFGAMLYSLHVGRELSESDFDRPGHPRPFLPLFPDAHPGFGRLISKTFRREVDLRFPTDEASRDDATGFGELYRTLKALGRTMDTVRLEVASWTTTGMLRSGNEDTFALLHACESRQDDLSEMALVLLADGMGGYEAGEVAAALAVGVLRDFLVKQKGFAPLAGASGFPTDPLALQRPEGHAPIPFDPEVCKLAIKQALKEANRQVFSASRAPGTRRRGMGCTAEVVYVDGRQVVIGHVGDSRTYHLHDGRLIQVTRDQTLVNRLVELGTLTPEEAENHPRRNELQQALGGQPDVDPAVYHGTLRAGDWVVVCSDGLSNQIPAEDLALMLQTEATSADMAARRLVNFANIRGAADNATVVVIRCT